MLADFSGVISHMPVCIKVSGQLPVGCMGIGHLSSRETLFYKGECQGGYLKGGL